MFYDPIISFNETFLIVAEFESNENIAAGEGGPAASNFPRRSKKDKEESLELARTNNHFAIAFLENASVPLTVHEETKLSLEDRKAFFELEDASISSLATSGFFGSTHAGLMSPKYESG